MNEELMEKREMIDKYVYRLFKNKDFLSSGTMYCILNNFRKVQYRGSEVTLSAGLRIYDFKVQPIAFGLCDGYKTISCDIVNKDNDKRFEDYEVECFASAIENSLELGYLRECLQKKKGEK